jgi:hypothetical protein
MPSSGMPTEWRPRQSLRERTTPCFSTYFSSAGCDLMNGCRRFGPARRRGAALALGRDSPFSACATAGAGTSPKISVQTFYRSRAPLKNTHPVLRSLLASMRHRLCADPIGRLLDQLARMHKLTDPPERLRRGHRGCNRQAGYADPFAFIVCDIDIQHHVPCRLDKQAVIEEAVSQ